MTLLDRHSAPSVSDWEYDRAAYDIGNDGLSSARVFHECGCPSRRGHAGNSYNRFQFDADFNGPFMPQARPMPAYERTPWHPPIAAGSFDFAPNQFQSDYVMPRRQFYAGPQLDHESGDFMSRRPFYPTPFKNRSHAEPFYNGEQFQPDYGFKIEPAVAHRNIKDVAFLTRGPSTAPAQDGAYIQPATYVKPGTSAESWLPKYDLPPIPGSSLPPRHEIGIPRSDLPTRSRDISRERETRERLESAVSWQQDTLTAYEDAVYYKKPLVIMFGDDGEHFNKQLKEINDDPTGRIRPIANNAIWVIGKPRYDAAAQNIANYLSIKPEDYPGLTIIEPDATKIEPRIIMEGYFEPTIIADQLEHYLDPRYAPPNTLPPQNDVLVA